MKLLISPQNEQEAAEAIAGGADIIDVKNPNEGPLGANFPWVIKQIRELTPKNLEVSCTIGESPNIPASISLAAYGAASLGVDYVKVGLYGTKTLAEAVNLLQNVTKPSRSAIQKSRLSPLDTQIFKGQITINPLLVPQATAEAKLDFAMLDTA